MYNQITANKRKTWLLIIMVSFFIILLSAVFGYAEGLDIISSVVLGTLFTTVYTLISYFASDKIALSSNGAVAIEKKDAPELWNIVENLCIAEGMPMPKVYIIQDPSPNAFATGRNPEKASIAFTTGLLQILDKNELTGVAAHELSHVKNYDTRVMTITVVLVGSLILMSDIFLRIGTMRRRDNDKNGNALLIFALVGIVLALLSPLIGQIIKFAVSRSREYLADASGALLTRYPEGLASALEKISGAGIPMRQASQATAHLYIANPFGNGGIKSLKNLFSTHPPIEERVKRLRSMGV